MWFVVIRLWCPSMASSRLCHRKWLLDTDLPAAAAADQQPISLSSFGLCLLWWMDLAGSGTGNLLSLCLWGCAKHFFLSDGSASHRSEKVKHNCIHAWWCEFSKGTEALDFGCAYEAEEEMIRKHPPHQKFLTAGCQLSCIY